MFIFKIKSQLFIYFRSNDRLKNNLIEALSRKGAAMCQLYYYNFMNTNIKDESYLQEIDDVWLQVICFISPDSDSKVC